MKTIVRQDIIEGHKRQNVVQSAVLLTAMLGIMALAGWMLFGTGGVVVALGGGLIFVWLASRQSTAMIMRMYKARRLGEHDAPRLLWLVGEISRRAGLREVPDVYYIPSAMMNAFALGRRSRPAIGLTDGLLRKLEVREVAGVLAHEIAHVRNNDMVVMGLADMFTRLTHFFSVFGQVMLFIYLPLLLFGEATMPFWPIVLLIAAPTLSALLQLALSRTREYNADLEAARITGDPAGLAAALEKLEQLQGGLLERLFLPGRRNPEPSALRTHPPTAERVRRLLAFGGIDAPKTPLFPSKPATHEYIDVLRHYPRVTGTPRWHISGLWY